LKLLATPRKVGVPARRTISRQTISRIVSAACFGRILEERHVQHIYSCRADAAKITDSYRFTTLLVPDPVATIPFTIPCADELLCFSLRRSYKTVRLPLPRCASGLLITAYVPALFRMASSERLIRRTGEPTLHFCWFYFQSAFFSGRPYIEIIHYNHLKSSKIYNVRCSDAAIKRIFFCSWLDEFAAEALTAPDVLIVLTTCSPCSGASRTRARRTETSRAAGESRAPAPAEQRPAEAAQCSQRLSPSGASDWVKGCHYVGPPPQTPSSAAFRPSTATTSVIARLRTPAAEGHATARHYFHSDSVCPSSAPSPHWPAL
jgi:hypothetical protein